MAFLLLLGGALGTAITDDYRMAQRRTRERALERQIRTLEAALEVNREAMAACAEMRGEAGRIREEHGHAQRTE